jgi:hypothetical protein
VAQAIWKEAGQRLVDYLNSVSLAEMCRMAREMGIEKQLGHRFMYFM